jgi:hypothetical protein
MITARLVPFFCMLRGLPERRRYGSCDTGENDERLQLEQR